jgi:hypothetical protein
MHGADISKKFWSFVVRPNAKFGSRKITDELFYHRSLLIRGHVRALDFNDHGGFSWPVYDQINFRVTFGLQERKLEVLAQITVQPLTFTQDKMFERFSVTRKESILIETFRMALVKKGEKKILRTAASGRTMESPNCFAVICSKVPIAGDQDGARRVRRSVVEPIGSGSRV